MKPGLVRLSVQVVPNARKSEVAGEIDGVLRIRLQAQPIEGRANEELVRLLAKLLGVSKSSVQVVQGLSARRKVIEIQCGSGADAHSIRQALLGQAG
ncbi:DUF167 domain-containing protein [Lacisediminimonas sp.]|uniref:DUF167 domain-containing protein n=1 Tax=Lacisediminimonas sp. TaxID=3060582 RepID=UPI002715E214|nr:DUF167 domain-containing protein [Lacisediminimonas sp.]MDO8298616.1 DUF167 domain-containing protein [Lacisediminimonas sp.]